MSHTLEARGVFREGGCDVVVEIKPPLKENRTDEIRRAINDAIKRDDQGYVYGITRYARSTMMDVCLHDTTCPVRGAEHDQELMRRGPIIVRDGLGAIGIQATILNT